MEDRAPPIADQARHRLGAADDRLFARCLLSLGVVCLGFAVRGCPSPHEPVTGSSALVDISRPAVPQDSPAQRLVESHELHASPHGPAWRTLATQISAGRLLNSSVVAAWLEREAARWDVSPEVMAARFSSRVEIALRDPGYQLAGTPAARIGALKRALLTRRDTLYNREAATVGHFLMNGRLQCLSGSLAVVLAWMASARVGDESVRAVFVYTEGHVRPGLVIAATLHFVEATALDSVVDSAPLASPSDLRVADAAAELAIVMLGDDSPPWLRKQALVREAAFRVASEERAMLQPAPIDDFSLAFGVADVARGDLPLAGHTGPTHKMQRRLVAPKIALPIPGRATGKFARLFAAPLRGGPWAPTTSAIIAQHRDAVRAR